MSPLPLPLPMPIAACSKSDAQPDEREAVQRERQGDYEVALNVRAVGRGARFKVWRRCLSKVFSFGQEMIQAIYA